MGRCASGGPYADQSVGLGPNCSKYASPSASKGFTWPVFDAGVDVDRVAGGGAGPDAEVDVLGHLTAARHGATTEGRVGDEGAARFATPRTDRRVASHSRAGLQRRQRFVRVAVRFAGLAAAHVQPSQSPECLCGKPYYFDFFDLKSPMSVGKFPCDA